MKQVHEQILAKTDPILEKIILELPKPEIVSTGDVFHDLMSCVVEQQIHYRSTKKIFQKMLERAGITRLTPDNFQQFEELSLGSAKLSMGKYETILRILDFWKSGIPDWQSLSDQEVITHLSTIKGIGKWTIDMVLLYTLERPDVFPVDDFHLKQIMVSLYGLDPNVKLKAQMMEISNLWGEQKSLAVRYLLAWKQHKKRDAGRT